MFRKIYDSILAQIENETEAQRLQIAAGTSYDGESFKTAERRCKIIMDWFDDSGLWDVLSWPDAGDEHGWKQVTPKVFKEYMAAGLTYLNNQGCSEIDLTVAILCALVLWKSVMVESRGMKYVFRHCHPETACDV